MVRRMTSDGVARPWFCRRGMSYLGTGNGDDIHGNDEGRGI